MRLTLNELNERYGGILPPDATLRSDTEEAPAPPTKPKRRTRSERFAVLNAFVDFGIAAGELTPAESLVWLVLFRDTKANGLARTGQTDIARRAGLSVRGVQKALDKLQAKGFIDVVHRGRLNAGPSVYRVQPTGTL